MRYFLLLLFSAGVGIAARIIPSEYGWLYEFVAPCATVLVIIGGWQRVSLIRKLVLLALALFVGWFADWSLHTLTHHPDSARALRAGLILFGIRAGVGIWLIIWSHFAWKNKYTNATSDSNPTLSSGSFQHIPPFEAGAILGAIGGVVSGAMLCRSYGILAEIGGAIGSGIVGLFAGALLIFPISMVCGLIGIVAKIYWEVLIGRRKLPSMSSQTKAHRRMMFKFMAVIFMVTTALWASLYFAEPDAIRSRLLSAVVPLLVTFFIGLLILVVAYRRHPAQKESNKDE